MPLVHFSYPGKEWVDIPLDQVPQEIQDAYKLKQPVVAVKRSPDGRIVIWFADDSHNDQTEVWQTLSGQWVHVGPRTRK